LGQQLMGRPGSQDLKRKQRKTKQQGTGGGKIGDTLPNGGSASSHTTEGMGWSVMARVTRSSLAKFTRLGGGKNGCPAGRGFWEGRNHL